VFEVNEKRDGRRKNGLLINTGKNPDKETKRKKVEANKAKYELSKEESDAIVLPTPELEASELLSAKVSRLSMLRARLELLETELLAKEEAINLKQAVNDVMQPMDLGLGEVPLEGDFNFGFDQLQEFAPTVKRKNDHDQNKSYNLPVEAGMKKAKVDQSLLSGEKAASDLD